MELKFAPRLSLHAGFYTRVIVSAIASIKLILLTQLSKYTIAVKKGTLYSHDSFLFPSGEILNQ